MLTTMNSNRAFIFLLSSGKIIILVFVLNLYFFSQFFFSGEDFKLNATYKEGVFQMELQTYDQKKDSQQNLLHQNLRSEENTTDMSKISHRPLEKHVLYTQQKALAGARLLDLLSYPQPEYIENVRSRCFFTDYPDKVASLRCFPSVFLAGFAKSGTTDLHTAISQHQHVISGFFKEPQFWHDLRPVEPTSDGSFLGGNKLLDEYLENYKCLSTVIEENVVRLHPIELDYDTRKLRPGKIQFQCNQKGINKGLSNLTQSPTQCPFVGIDSSPMYMYEGHLWEFDPTNNESKQVPKILTPHRIEHFIPNPKIIVLMRNPVDRLFSDFKFFTEGSYNREYFDTLISNGIAWWNQCVKSLPLYRCAFGRDFSGTNMSSLGNDRGLFDWGDSESVHHNGANRLRYSLYVIYIKKWLEVFPRNSFLFVKTEEYATDALGVLTNQIFPFLGLEPMSEKAMLQLITLQKMGRRNAYDKVKFNMLPQTRKQLELFFKPYNEELCQLLGTDKFKWTD